MSVKNIINPSTGKIDNSFLDLGLIIVPTLSSVLDGGNKANKEIDMSSNYIINCKDPVNNQDVATKKYVDDNGGGGNPSTWSQYPATQTVNLSDNYISGSGSQVSGPFININNNIDGMSQPWMGLRLNSIKAGNQNKSLTFSVGDGEGTISSQWESYIMQSLKLVGEPIVLNTLTTTLTGSLNFQTPNLINNCNQVKAPIGGDLTLNCDGGGNLNFMFNSYNRITTDQNGIMTFYTNPRCSEVPTLNNQLVNKLYVDSKVPNFKSTYSFYVSKQGSDISNNGSILSPYLTIQKAITASEALPTTSSNMGVIFVDCGQYTENLTITKGYLTIQSSDMSPVPAGTTMIIGNISIAITGSNDLYGKQINFSNIDITGTITDNSTASHSISFTNNYIYTSNRAIYINATSPDQRTYIKNCFINQTSAGINPVIDVSNGWFYCENSSVISSANTNLINIGGSAYATKIGFNDLQNSNNSTSIKPIISILSSSTSPHSIGGNSFVYTTLALRNASPYSSGIYFSTGSVNSNAIIAQNLFSLLGTTDIAGANHVIVKDSGMTGNVSIYQMGNYGFVGCTKVQNTITQLSATLVN